MPRVRRTKSAYWQSSDVCERIRAEAEHYLLMAQHLHGDRSCTGACKRSSKEAIKALKDARAFAASKKRCPRAASRLAFGMIEMGVAKENFPKEHPRYRRGRK